MTIASHCVDLLRANGPMTREELGESCRVARVTAANDPGLAVQGALQYDGRVLRVDGSYYLVERLLDGRWLTLERPADPEWFDTDIDLQCLKGLASRGGVPLAAGGRLGRRSYAGHRRLDVAQALLELLHEDDDLLRKPVPPLSRLFPAPPPDTRRNGSPGHNGPPRPCGSGGSGRRRRHDQRRRHGRADEAPT